MEAESEEDDDDDDDKKVSGDVMPGCGAVTSTTVTNR